MRYILCLLIMFSLNKMQAQSYDEFVTSMKYCALGDGNIAYQDEGEGPVILLVHGVPSSAWLYRKMVPYLVKEGFRVISIDMLGFGQSDKPDDYDLYTHVEHGRRLHEFMAALEIGAWTHVCHDAGTYWSLAMLDQDASKVKNIIFLNSVMLQSGFDPPMTFKPGFKADMMLSSYKGPFNKAILKKTLKDGLRNKDIIDKNMIQGYSKPLRKQNICGLYYFFTQTHKPLIDYSPLLQSLDIPMSVIWGKDDPFLKWEPMEEEFISLTNIEAQNVHILDAAHFIQEEKAEEVSKMIIKFLDN